ncbi:MAG: AraC family transcriptional regulator [Capnocytophaga sp.]|nr:AraC family transcriptional regulator [Capnocytophaga sp.]
MKIVKVPHDLPKAPHYQNVIELEDVSIVESCTQAHETKKIMFLEDHFLLFVLEGTFKIKYGGTFFEIRENEMILLPKFISIEAWKYGNPENEYAFESMAFFIKDEFLLDFLKKESIKLFKSQELTPIFVRPFKERLLKFLESLKPYFRDKEDINANLYRIKMMELLYDLAHTDKNLLLQLMQLKNRQRTDIPKVMAENYLNPVSLNELAYLSGRSLSSFRRDFEAIYKISPGKWIQEKRMQKAKELLSATEMTVADVCYHIGYENISHFSRLFKSFWGYNPSEVKLGIRD